MANTWNEPGTTWSTGDWGQQNITTVYLIAPNTLTTNVGSIESFNETGWGSDLYGLENWGASGLLVPITAPNAATTSIGSLDIVRFPGWGTLDWGENGWGSVEAAVENLVAPSALQSNVGSISPEDVVGLTGLQAITNTGSFTFILSPTITPAGQQATTSEGQLNINDGADHVQGLASLVATTATGSLDPADVVGITGVQASTGVGEIEITTAFTLDLVAPAAAVSSNGSLITEVVYVLGGLQSTTSVGSISPADVMGLTGLQANIDVGILGIIGYGNVVIEGNTNYSAVDITGNTSYTDVTHVA